jgi:hypothetical protein
MPMAEVLGALHSAELASLVEHGAVFSRMSPEATLRRAVANPYAKGAVAPSPSYCGSSP